MNDKAVSNQSFPWARVLLSAALLFILLLGMRDLVRPDFWTHLASGRLIAQEGIPHQDTLSLPAQHQPWVDTSWLYDLLLFRLWSIGGATLVVLAHALVLTLAFALLLPAALSLGSGLSAAYALLLCGWTAAGVVDAQPFVMAMVFPALFISQLYNRKLTPARWGILAAGQILWTNLHASFLLGPAIPLAFAVQAWAASRKGRANGTDTPNKLFLLTGVLALLTLCNPYFFGLHTWILGLLRTPGLAFLWQQPPAAAPMGLFPGNVAFYLALVVTAAGLVAHKKKLPLAFVCLAIGAAFLAVMSHRFLLLFAVLAFPFLSLSMRASGLSLRQIVGTVIPAVGREGERWARGLFVALALASLIVIPSGLFYARSGLFTRFGLRAQTDLYPEEAALILDRPDFPPVCLNLLRDGGYLAWRYPQRNVFMDSRIKLYPPAHYQDLIKALFQGDSEAWARIVTQWRPEAVVLNALEPNAPLAARRLADSGGWRLLYFDGVSIVFVRNTAQHAALLRDRTIQQRGLEILEADRKNYAAQLAGVLPARTSPRLVGAGSFFLTFQQYKEAHAIYRLLALGLPRSGLVQHNLGVSAFQLGLKDEALAAFKRASELMKKNALTWIWLSRAYEATGENWESQQAEKEARRLNPKIAKQALETWSKQEKTPPKAK